MAVVSVNPVCCVSLLMRRLTTTWCCRIDAQASRVRVCSRVLVNSAQGFARQQTPGQGTATTATATASEVVKIVSLCLPSRNEPERRRSACTDTVAAAVARQRSPQCATSVRRRRAPFISDSWVATPVRLIGVGWFGRYQVWPADDVRCPGEPQLSGGCGHDRPSRPIRLAQVTRSRPDRM